MIKVAAIGECMIEMLPQDGGLYKCGYAGDTFNMAQYLAWIGENVQVSYVTALGADRFGREMLQVWQDNNIDTSLVMSSTEKSSGLYFADTDENGNRDYTFFRSDSAAKQMFNLPDSGRVFETVLTYDVVYASAITMMILNETDRQKLIDLFKTAREKGIKTVFDTNYRAAGWKSADDAATWMTFILRHTDIALPTDDENRTVFGDKDAQETIDRIKALGVPEIAVKCGKEDCLSHHKGQQTRVAAAKDVKIADTTSAGDSFNAAYLYGRLNGLSPEEAAKWGHELASIVIQHRGALIPRDKIPHFQPKENAA